MDAAPQRNQPWAQQVDRMCANSDNMQDLGPCARLLLRRETLRHGSHAAAPASPNSLTGGSALRMHSEAPRQSNHDHFKLCARSRPPSTTAGNNTPVVIGMHMHLRAKESRERACRLVPEHTRPPTTQCRQSTLAMHIPITVCPRQDGCAC